LAVQKVFAPKLHLKFKKKLFGGSLAETEVNGKTVYFLLPERYMNRSGEVLSACLKRVKVPASDILVIYDDVDLEFGKLRFRTSGSSGGHLGVESILRNLKTEHFHRLRIGIGRPPVGREVSDYVLERFSPEEEKMLPAVWKQVEKAVTAWLEEGSEKARDAIAAFNL
jgi:PTH1 family peptidyl-tRNA hydrolase